MVSPRKIRILFASLAIAGAAVGLADETWYETKGNTTYRVTKRLEKQPATDVRVEQRTETVYVTEYVTELRETTRMVWVPVTRYVTEPRWHNWWNPLAEPYLAYHPRAVTHWEARLQTVREPVSMARQVPQERLVQVPVRELGFVEQPVEERIAVRVTPPPAPQAIPELRPDTDTPERFADRPAPPVIREWQRGGQPVTDLTSPLRR